MAEPQALAPLTDAPAPHALADDLRGAARRMRNAAARAARPARVAVLLPCYNEAATIARVVADFRTALPTARICVFDNASGDGTGEAARAAGAEVFFVAARGKGNVVRAMFADVDADVYVMADGDGTYDAASAPRLVAAVLDDRVDMAVGARENVHVEAHRPGHAFGNRLFNRLYGWLFGAAYGDIFSGFRAFSRRFVKSFPALSQGFEIETELCVHASQMKLATVEIATPYGKRVEGSASKLSSLRDGWRILMAFAYLLKETRPALFFGAPALGVAGAALVLAWPLVETWLATGLVPRLPTAILCTGLMLVAALLGVCGLILDSLARSRAEHKRMLYLALSGAREG
jgi:glycosyltransferase involved in cell wall biosynthesis